MDWRINVPVAGNYQFNIRYANGSSNRPAVVSVNGSTAAGIDFPSSGGWASYTDASSTSVFLPVGSNDVRLVANNGSGLANIDRLRVTGFSPSPGSCNQ